MEGKKKQEKKLDRTKKKKNGREGSGQTAEAELTSCRV